MKIQPKTIDLITKVCEITTEFVGINLQSFLLRSIAHVALNINISKFIYHRRTIFPESVLSHDLIFSRKYLSAFTSKLIQTLLMQTILQYLILRYSVFRVIRNALRQNKT